MLSKVLQALRQVVLARPATSPDVGRVILQAVCVQRWFVATRGQGAIKQACSDCGGERVFVIWRDGTYRCYACLCRQAADGRYGPIPLGEDLETQRVFQEVWGSYTRCASGIDPGWFRGGSVNLCLGKDCRTCLAFRPHVRREDGGSRCLHCLMQEALQRRTPACKPTRDRLDAAAKAAIAFLLPEPAGS
mgnify:CR=1 FL=1